MYINWSPVPPTFQTGSTPLQSPITSDDTVNNRKQDIPLLDPLSVSQSDFQIPASAPYIYLTSVYGGFCADQNNNSNSILCTNILEYLVNVNNEGSSTEDIRKLRRIDIIKDRGF